MTTFTPLALPEVLLITPKRHGDARGWFSETWSRKAFEAAGLDHDFVQDNQAYNPKAGTLRGLHFQTAPAAQAKLLRVLRGAVFDVAVDIRPGSPTYGKFASATLTAEGGEQILVPRGFAHGYLTLTDDCEVAYKVDGPYAPETEGGLVWNDAAIGIPWPLAGEPMVNARDQAWPALKDLPAQAF
ncbi:MAG: dTDP-4-dehydrorhamnose 3,5-epimerase [Phenylobacterium sp.]|uniref:dTDP-4-dehydrorhamnose 3,5-epimerase n=1 Tax=Phenylobacterium sp. TaxID=1871053 RepID=UPI00391D31EB